MSEDFRAKWYASMRKRLNVETDDEVRQFMRESADKSSRNSKGTGGWAYIKENKPEEFKEWSAKGGKASRRSKRDI